MIDAEECPQFECQIEAEQPIPALRVIFFSYVRYIKDLLSGLDNDSQEQLTSELEAVAKAADATGDQLLDSLVHLQLKCQHVNANMAIVLEHVNEVVKKDLKRASLCSGCIVRQYNASDEYNGFTEVCTKPHAIIWAQPLFGKEPYPAKVLQVTRRHVYVRYFGDHKTAIVSTDRCYQITKEYLWGEMTGECKAAMEKFLLHSIKVDLIYKGTKSMFADGMIKFKGNLHLEDCGDEANWSSDDHRPEVAVNKAPSAAATIHNLCQCIIGYIKGHVKSKDKNALDLLNEELDVMLGTNYVSGDEVLADLDNLRRNYKFNDRKCLVRKNIAVQLGLFFKNAKNEVELAETCIDCVVNYYGYGGEPDADLWFTAVCFKPHAIVWAHQQSYEPYPAKVLELIGDKVKVRFFGKLHQTAILPRDKCYAFTRKYLWSEMTRDLKKAMDEVEIHCSNIIDTYSGSKIIYAACDKQQPYNGNLYLQEVKLETISQVSGDMLSVAIVGLNPESPMSSSSKDTQATAFNDGFGSGISLVDGSRIVAPGVLANRGSILTKSAFTLPRASCPICHTLMAKKSIDRHKYLVHGLTPKKATGKKVRKGRLF